MLDSFLAAHDHENQPLVNLSIEMKWYITFTPQEVSDLRKLRDILKPMDNIFTKLGGDKESTIMAVVPTLKVSHYNPPPIYQIIRVFFASYPRN